MKKGIWWWLTKQLIRDLWYTTLAHILVRLGFTKEKPPFHPWNERDPDDD